VRQGGLPVLYCIGTGPRSAMPNVQPSSRRLEHGDIIRFDVGGRYRHYRADIARVAVLGEPSKKIRTYHHALHTGVQRGIDLLRPGVPAARIFETVVETVRQEGIPHYRRTHVGHGIGIDGYDLPDLSATSTDVIEEGMVLCVETPYYELGFGGLQVEDMVVVRREGAETLMGSSGALRVISRPRARRVSTRADCATLRRATCAAPPARANWRPRPTDWPEATSRQIWQFCRSASLSISSDFACAIPSPVQSSK
jgi:Xaa-Pro aminopeptidase